MTHLQRRAGAWVLVALLTGLAGCQSIATRDDLPKDVAPSRKARLAELTGQITRKRDSAELLSARECLQRGDPAGCQAVLAPLLKRNPDHIDARLLLAEALVAQDRGQQAIAELQLLAQQHPDHAQLQHTLGVLCENAGDLDQAKTYYDQALRCDPHNDAYRLSCESAARATAADAPIVPMPNLSAVDFSTPASEAVKQVAFNLPAKPAPPAAKPHPARAASNEADRCLSRGLDSLHRGSVDAARPLFEKAMAANPHDPQIPLSAAVAALECNHPDVAIALVKPALLRFPKSAALHRVLGTAYYRQGDFADSQTALQQALSLDKSSALSYFLMGCTLTRLGQTEAAADQFRRAGQIDPRFAVQR